MSLKYYLFCRKNYQNLIYNINDIIQNYEEMTNQYYIHIDDIIKENKMYNTQFSGSINLRTPLQASAVATKGHFYQVSPVVKDQLANIHNRKGETIKPDQANDDLIYLDR